MTSKLGSAATAKTVQRMSGASGVQASLALLTQGELGTAGTSEAVQIRTQNATAELTERAGAIRYPVMNVYCHRLVNDLKQKFRAFSGRASIVVEVRYSQDRLEDLESKLHLYVDSVAHLLDRNRGDWGDGMFYGGGYEVTFGAIKHGGKNFLQSATVTFAVEISR